MISYAAVSSVRRAGFGRIELSRADGLAVVISEPALDSLEACTLLADGLGTNPAVAPASADLLQPWMAAATSRRDRALSRRHKVDRSGTTHTFHAMRSFHVVTGTVVAVVGASLLVFVPAALVFPHWTFFQSGPGRGTFLGNTLGSIAVGLPLMWIGIRMVGVGVKISADRIIIRGYFHTRTVKARAIRAISLQPRDNGEGQLRWIPQIKLASGKSLSIYSFDCGPARKPPRPEMAATIEEIRTLLGVTTLDPDEQQERDSDGLGSAGGPARR